MKNSKKLHWTQTEKGKKKLEELKRKRNEIEITSLAPVETAVINSDKLTVIQVIARLIERVNSDQKLIEELTDLEMELREGKL